jgi:hypothetical protein
MPPAQRGSLKPDSPQGIDILIGGEESRSKAVADVAEIQNFD